jgi:hypothetical protein
MQVNFQPYSVVHDWPHYPIQGSREESNKLTRNAQVDNSGSEKRARLKKITVAENIEKINEQVYYSGSEYSEKFE